MNPATQPYLADFWGDIGSFFGGGDSSGVINSFLPTTNDGGGAISATNPNSRYVYDANIGEWVLADGVTPTPADLQELLNRNYPSSGSSSNPSVSRVPTQPGAPNNTGLFGAFGSLLGGLFGTNNQPTYRPYTPTINPATGQPYPVGYNPYGQTLPQYASSSLGTSFNLFAAQFGVSPTTLILLLGGGAYLLFRDPPRRGR